ncbi:MAG: DUF4279 domain-containing protein [Colwellia sp.]|nr:DUF4279 domain-containing protein [Colwellia sp.]
MKTNVYFGVFGFDCGHEQITKIAGVTPTMAWNKGEHYSGKYPEAIRTHSRWVLDSGLQDSEEIELKLNAVLEQVAENIDGLRKVISLHNCKIVIAQDFDGGCVSFDISSQCINQIADLELGIWVDQN